MEAERQFLQGLVADDNTNRHIVQNGNFMYGTTVDRILNGASPTLSVEDKKASFIRTLQPPILFSRLTKPEEGQEVDEDRFMESYNQVIEYFTDRQDPASPNASKTFELSFKTHVLLESEMKAFYALSQEIKQSLRVTDA
jgi:hypothetical protein